MYLRNKNIKLLFKYLIIPLLAGWLFYSLYKQVHHQPHLAETWEVIKQSPFGTDSSKFWLAIALSVLNWGLEATKWKYLMRPLEKMTFGTAFKSVLSGITLSINTPNRVGEYGGRMLYVGRGKKLKSISLSITGSISQLIVTLVMGIAGLIYLLVMTADDQGTMLMGFSSVWVKTLLIAVIIAASLTIFFFFKIPLLTRLCSKLSFAKKMMPYVRSLENYNHTILLKVLILSFLRYCVFISQYLLLFHLWEVHIFWVTEVWLLAVLFLVMAVVPSFAIADLGLRGQFGIALFGLFSYNKIGIIATIFGIWVINLFLPAVAGSIIILSSRFFRREK